VQGSAFWGLQNLNSTFSPIFLKKYEKLEKALGERRYLRQGKAIRQVVSPSSLCQRFPYSPFNEW